MLMHATGLHIQFFAQFAGLLSDLDPRLDALQALELETRPPVNPDQLQLLRAFSDDRHDDGKFFAPSVHNISCI